MPCPIFPSTKITSKDNKPCDCNANSTYSSFPNYESNKTRYEHTCKCNPGYIKQNNFWKADSCEKPTY